eukprot:2487814-Rhodomonas_salina.2
MPPYESPSWSHSTRTLSHGPLTSGSLMTGLTSASSLFSRRRTRLNAFWGGADCRVVRPRRARALASGAGTSFQNAPAEIAARGSACRAAGAAELFAEQ